MKKAHGWFVTMVALSALASACNEGPGSPTAQPEPSQTVSGTTACPDVAQAFENGSRLGGALRGDVTGDGTEDSVYLVREEAGQAPCRDLLFADTERGVLASELSDGRQSSLPQPRLNGLAAIDDRPGAEIVVDVEQGASTQFVGVFTILDGELQRVRLPGEGGLGDLFPYGGSVGHIEASDCGEDGTIIVSVATPTRERYEVERSVYRFDGVALEPDRAASERIQVAVEEVQDLPEYRSPPFGSCARS